ncbi:MAG: inositol monophosphatase [Candidatus Rokubacteria bacterium]|nr:inositol monophosphatase [Candidatus Rokubacteria bacterium]
MSPFLPIAVDAARSAGKLLREALGGARRISYKGSPTNLVTEMDRRSEALIVERLLQAFPDHAILGEEGGARPGASEYRWLIDPLDGTTNYAHGAPVFSVSIALERAGQSELGVAYDPNLDELFVAQRGVGATLNGEPIGVSDTAALGESLLATGFPYDIRTTTATNLPEYAALSLRCHAVRRLGSAVLDLCYVAAGRFDAFWELSLGPWDMAAGGLMVLEAGGRLTNVRGGPWALEGPGALASNGLIHDAVLEVLEVVRAGRR